MARIRMLKQYNVRPIMVFDGAPLPMKALKEASRLK
jgi:5'-3' exonuclease